MGLLDALTEYCADEFYKYATNEQIHNMHKNSLDCFSAGDKFRKISLKCLCAVDEFVQLSDLLIYRNMAIVNSVLTHRVYVVVVVLKVRRRLITICRVGVQTTIVRNSCITMYADILGGIALK